MTSPLLAQVHGVSVIIEHTSKTYELRDSSELLALDRMDVRIAPGEFVSIVGPSGCGKSTLLAMVAGLLPASTGRILVDDIEIKRPHPKVGVVFQADLLLYWRTILENVLLPVEIKGWPRQKYLARSNELLEQVGLKGFGGKYPSELSGGMRQRAAICRALVQEPGLLLMDEPFGALDALTREQMIGDLQTMWLSVKNTVLFITHSIEEAVFLADRVLVMSPRPGRIDLDRRIELERPRHWKSRFEPKFIDYLTEIRTIFEAQGILSNS